MLFRIRLPRFDDVPETLDDDGEPRDDLKRYKLPKDHTCSCYCSFWDMTSTWNFMLEPIFISFP